MTLRYERLPALRVRYVSKLLTIQTEIHGILKWWMYRDVGCIRRGTYCSGTFYHRRYRYMFRTASRNCFYNGKHSHTILPYSYSMTVGLWV
jgi:hypothetical protein